MDALYDLYNNEICQNFIAQNMVTLYLLPNTTIHERDNFFRKMPEVLCYLIINALQFAQTKHHRIFSSNKFREIILDFLLELITGFMIYNCSTVIH